jgi:hypothetical protein
MALWFVLGNNVRFPRFRIIDQIWIIVSIIKHYQPNGNAWIIVVQEITS